MINLELERDNLIKIIPDKPLKCITIYHTERSKEFIKSPGTQLNTGEKIQIIITAEGKQTQIK